MCESENLPNNFNMYSLDKKNLYEILEIPQKASKTEIKKGYKKLILKYHPDKNNQKTSDKFLEVKNAFDILYDDEKRELYDKYLLFNDSKQLNVFEYFTKKKINSLLMNFINSIDIEKIIKIFAKKKISYDYFENLFLDSHDNFKKEIVNINISINFTLKDLWQCNSINLSYNRVTKEKFDEEIFPFDEVQIYEGEGEKIKFDNIELNGNIIIKINITDTKINGEQYYIYKNELYVLVDSNRIKNNKFILNFLDGDKYKFNINKLNQVENELGKFYLKKNFGLINNFNDKIKTEGINNKDNDYIKNNNYSHGNLYFIILI